MRDAIATAKAILEKNSSIKEMEHDKAEIQKMKAEMMAMKEAMMQHMTDNDATTEEMDKMMDKMENMAYEELKNLMKKEGIKYEAYVSEDVGTATGGAQELDLSSVDNPFSTRADADKDLKTLGDVKKKKKVAAGTIKSSDANSKVVDDKKDLPMKEDLDALFSGEELSEDFKNKAAVIFESALALRTKQIQESLEAEYAEIYEASKEEYRSDLASKMDEYLSYVIEEWMKDNEIAIERGLRADIAESFLTGLKGLFEQHYISIPEEKYDVLEELTKKVESLEESLNSQMKKNAELRKDSMISRCINIFNEATDGLSDSEVEKLKALAEGLEYDSEDQFRQKIAVIRENYFTPSNDTNELANEIVGETISEAVEEQVSHLNESMKFYSDMLSRSAHIKKQTNFLK